MNILKEYVQTTRKLFVVLLLLALTFVYAMFQGGFVSWFLFYSFLPFGLYSILLSIYPFTMVNVIRKTNQKEYTAGEKFIATLEIQRKIPFPLFYMIIEEVIPQQLRTTTLTKGTKVILFPGFKRNLTCQYSFQIPRGEHLFSTIRLKTGDMFGLVEKEIQVDVEDRFLVYPSYINMVYRQIESKFEQGTAASNLNMQRDTTIAVGVREYKPGDRFSWIDWKSSARKNSIMTKEFEQQQSHDVVIVMDRLKSRFFEQTITFTASLVRAVLRKGAQVGFISVGSERTVLPVKSGEMQQHQIFYHLAKVQDDSPFSFAHVVETESKKIYQNVTFMLVTSELTEETVKVIEKMFLRQIELLLFIVKGKDTQLSQDELRLIDEIRKRNYFVKVVYEGGYSDVFFEVSRS
ncbi:DUF58 domain-containing protein [Bacillus timonensis]|nr:DUF58 domain-containing protein [Bacillus timonensis]